MKKHIQKIAVLLLVAATMLTVSCKKDKKDSSESAVVLNKVECTYTLSFDTPNASDFREAYDLFIDYYDSEGQIQSSTEFISQDFNWQVNVARTTFPSMYGFQIRVTPTSDHSIVPDVAIFSFEATLSVDGNLIYSDGSTKHFGGEQMYSKSGITPYIDVTYRESMRFEVKADGNVVSYENWE